MVVMLTAHRHLVGIYEQAIHLVRIGGYTFLNLECVVMYSIICCVAGYLFMFS